MFSAYFECLKLIVVAVILSNGLKLSTEFFHSFVQAMYPMLKMKSWKGKKNFISSFFKTHTVKKMSQSQKTLFKPI